MIPIDPLMKEHRLNEEMNQLMKDEIEKMRKYNKVNPIFIETAVDFIRMYADRTHHGKEEDILFRELKKKKLSPNHEKIMNELIEEHKWARDTVGKLVACKDRYFDGNVKSLNEILSLMIEIVNFYQKHIEKEDKHFFIPVMKYFTEEEQEDMLQEFWDFDKYLIHEKYEQVIKKLSSKSEDI
jgi:hemerythrin-like domain-containing protein